MLVHPQAVLAVDDGSEVVRHIVERPLEGTASIIRQDIGSPVDAERIQRHKETDRRSGRIQLGLNLRRRAASRIDYETQD